MRKIKQSIPIGKLALNNGQIDWLPRNPRQWTKDDIRRMVKSLDEDPDFMEDRPPLVTPQDDGDFCVFAGNERTEAEKKRGKRKEIEVIVYYPENDDDRETVIRRAVKDNGHFGSWDYDVLANEWDVPFTDWGVPAWDVLSESKEEGDDLTDEEIEKKMREFREKLDSGEIREEDEEYQAFLEKFQAKKTTDDCFTPDVVYTAVAEWVATKYGIKRKDMVRPFYPGGDYQKENYPKGAVVVDNPPFSILSQILTFYKENGIKFFLFAPTLTLFSSSSSSSALPCGVAITYENGASVNTSFLTNLEPVSVRLRSEPSLYRAVKKANDENLREMRKELPKYSYDHHIITAPFIGALSRLGIEFSVPVSESEPISQLEVQKASAKAIYGKGYIISDRVFAEREKAEREKAEREKAERWELSEKELAIVRRLNMKIEE
jgi:hypothetical protein